MKKKNFLIFFSFFLLTGCGILATQDDIINLEKDISQMTEGIKKNLDENAAVNIKIKDEIINEIEKLKKANADLRMNIDTQTNYINQISGKVDQSNSIYQDIKTNRDYTDTIDKRLSVIEERLINLMMVSTMTPTMVSTNTVIAASPEEIYNIARSDYSRQNYSLAIIGFQKVIDIYPNTEYSKHASYDIIVAYFAQRDWGNICEKADIFINLYPNDDLARKVYVIKAKSLIKLNDIEESRRIYTKIIKLYPFSEEAKIAKDELDYLNDKEIIKNKEKKNKKDNSKKTLKSEKSEKKVKDKTVKKIKNKKNVDKKNKLKVDDPS